MKSETRKAIAFIAVGILLAAVLGLIVWKATTPSSPQTREASATSNASTHSSAGIDDDPSRPTGIIDDEKDANRGGARGNTGNTGEDNTVAEQSSAQQDSDLGSDPFLPPNAVIASGAQATQPTRIFRPDNVTATGEAPESGDDTDTASETTTQQRPSQAPDTTTTTPGNPTPTETSPAEPTPVETTSPEAPGEQAQPEPSPEPGPASQVIEQLQDQVNDILPTTQQGPTEPTDGDQPAGGADNEPTQPGEQANPTPQHGADHDGAALRRPADAGLTGPVGPRGAELSAPLLSN